MSSPGIQVAIEQEVSQDRKQFFAHHLVSAEHAVGAQAEDDRHEKECTTTTNGCILVSMLNYILYQIYVVKISVLSNKEKASRRKTMSARKKAQRRIAVFLQK